MGLLNQDWTISWVMCFLVSVNLHVVYICVSSLVVVFGRFFSLVLCLSLTFVFVITFLDVAILVVCSICCFGLVCLFVFLWFC